MPLVANLGRNVDEWCKRTRKPRSTWHICRCCLRKHGRHGLAGLLPRYNHDPSGYGGVGQEVDASPTVYKDSGLTCAVCAASLTEVDQ